MIKSTIRKIMDDVQTISYKQLENRLEKYSEISFDIFDTLIKKEMYLSQQMFFRLMGKCMRDDSFYENRVGAERIARQALGEVSLEDIYTIMYSNNEDNKQKLMLNEIEYENSLCTVNKDMIDIYNRIVKRKKYFLYLICTLAEKLYSQFLIIME